MRDGRRGAVVAALAAGLLLACGGEAPKSGPAATAQPEATATQAAPSGEDGRPVVEEVRLEPMDPLPGQVVQATARASDPEGDPVRFRYAWRLNGRDLGVDADHVELRDAVKGDQVEVTVWPRDPHGEGQPYSVHAEVANRPPRILGLAIEGADKVKPGTDIVASPRVDDPDGDDVEVAFDWTVNGESMDEHGPRLSTDKLRRGDRVQVTAVARDGDDESQPATSKVVEIANSPPEILSHVKWERDGKSFRYQVEARDRDGDQTLRYRLKEAPPGMTIDPIDGKVTWTPDASQEGQHKLEIVVDDLHGGQTVQKVTVDIKVDQQKDEAQAPAAPAP